MAQDGCDRKEAQGNMDAFLENPQGEFALILLSRHIFSWIVPLTFRQSTPKIQTGDFKKYRSKTELIRKIMPMQTWSRNKLFLRQFGV